MKEGSNDLPYSNRFTVDELEESCGSWAMNILFNGSFRFSKSDWKKGGSGGTTITVKENGLE